MSTLTRWLGLDRAAGAGDLARAAVFQLSGPTSAADVVAAGAGPAYGVAGLDDVVDRKTAMTIPAVRRGRQVIAGTVGALQLVAHRTNPDGTVEDVTSARQLLTQPDPNVTLHYTLTWTVDDLLFYGVSWWLVLDRDPQGFPRLAERVHPDRVVVDVARGVVYVDGVNANGRLIRFDGPDEGVLTYGGRTLRTCLLLEEAVRKFARLDVPLGVMRLAEGAPELSPDEVNELLDEWEEARRTRTTAYLNRAIDYSALQFNAEQLQLAEVRQQQAAEVARLLNLAPRHVNAPNASSMTYATTESDRRDLLDTSLNGYIEAIEQRLSMGDVTPRGTVVRFDVTDLLRGDQLSALQAAQLALQLRAMTPDEVRTDVLGRPPLTPAQRDQLPALSAAPAAPNTPANPTTPGA